MPWTRVYSDKTEFERASADNPEIRGLTYRGALLEATEQLMETDDSVFVIGEGVDDPGGVFGTTLGLHKRFGAERVMDSPLAENGVTGIAVGAAIAGMKPILVHMRVDFLPLTMDQIINHAAKWHYMFGGRLNVPLTIRSIIGRGWGSAAQHSQSLHTLFMNIPGLRVVMPATPYDAKGLLVSSVRDGNPVIFIEHRWLYEQMGHVPEELYEVPVGKAIVRRTGTDVTIAAISQMVPEAVSAARSLEGEGIECEVIDLRTVKPLDTELVIESVSKTGRLLVADTGWKDAGPGAEIISRVCEEAFGALKAAPVRINLPEAPTPASPVLERAYYRGKDDIIASVKKML